MAKSFADSLNAMASAQASTMSLRNSVALAAEEESWTLHTGYDTTDNFAVGKRYSDEHISYVDEKKNVTVNDYQVNLTQEENSQYIPFEMNRYYDGIDLTTMKLSFYFENIEGGWGEREAINVRYTDTKIRLGFLVPKEATLIVGKLKFEIHATGSDPFGGRYVWKTRPNEDLDILESLQGNGEYIIDPGFAENVLDEVKEAASDAQYASAQAKTYADNAQTLNTQTTETVNAALEEIDIKIASVEATIKDDVVAELSIQYYTREETDSAITTALVPVNEDISELDNRVTKAEGDILSLQGEVENRYTKDETLSASEIEQKIADIDVTTQLEQLETKIAGEYYNKTEIDTKLDQIDVSDQLENYYTKTESNEKFADISIEELVTTHTNDIQTANAAIAAINAVLETIDTSPNKTYEAVYNDTSDPNCGENVFVLYEITNEGKENEEKVIKSKFTIVGGSGGSTSANTIKIERITNSPVVATVNDSVLLEYMFTGTDSSGEDIGQGTATWKIGSRVIKNETVYTGRNSIDLKDYISIGSDQKVTLVITDDIGTQQQKIWYVSIVNVSLESSFDDTKKYDANKAVSFTFTPYGAVDKTVHILMDGKEIGTMESLKSAAGLSTSYSLPAQSHDTHLVEIYMTAQINENDIESNHIVKDVIWYDENSDVPVISCIDQDFTIRQYETRNISYTVYDPSTETPTVTLKATYVNEDGETIEEYNSTVTMTENTNIWQFKTSEIGEHILTITCGNTIKTLKVTVEDLGIEVSPTTTGLEFDFNPVGYSNNDVNRVWSDTNTNVAMSVSDNFDWVNGGYQMDENGDQYFCIKSGTRATIDYNLFNDDAKTNGKEFKVIFKTANVKNRATSFISCMDYGIGLDMKIESANIYSSNGSLNSPYCEEDIIEFEFNIYKMAEMPIVLTYEDGVPYRPMTYTSDSSFWQSNPTPIVIGSDYCDVHIYRMKAYSTSLSDRDILNNFIADARNAEEMIKRHTRNQIYKDGILDPEYLAEVCPDLHVLLIDAPWFTNDKDDKVDDTNFTMIYKDGDPVLDNWTCTGGRHNGQGTSSNEYGDAARNIDVVMNTDTSVITLGDGTIVDAITLSRNSIPVAYLNLKVNVASSECENNAQHARRYNEFNPFIRAIRAKDSRVKDTMEFYNCVVFVRERNEDISTHREFQDTDYHFYSIGNIGDSKKTDNTRVNDPNDPKEHILEITDYNVPLAEFPTGADGICPESEWKEGNTAYDNLYAEYKYKDGKFKSFGNDSYEFRYEMKGITEEQRQINIDTWRELYRFIVTSSDEEFHARLKEYFVVNSALYNYLYTERHTMVDNRAKNSFWHYGKVYITAAEAELLGDEAIGYIVDDEQAAIRDGYRYDLTQGYDFDTADGIDNTGRAVITYGKEDVDYYVDDDPSSGYIFRAAKSTFFCRLRDLFPSEMQSLYVECESKGAWSSSSFIKQWDDAQNQFPEELWRIYYYRLYFRTYLGISSDNSIPVTNQRFLIEMMNGRKKYQRRMIDRNNEMYFATKYFGTFATQDQIMMRFNNPEGTSLKADFTMRITPYSDMYIAIKPGNVTPTNFRAKAGVEYVIPYSIDTATADITLVYGASFIQGMGDLSKCFVGANDFSKATRMQVLILGSNEDGYYNPFMTTVKLSNNKMLEYLDIQNTTAMTDVVDLSNCGNLIELHAEGSTAPGFIFANGGKLEKAYLPSITSLTAKNLNYIKEFVVDSYENLQTLVVENTPTINTYDIIIAALKLVTLRLIGMNWDSSYGIKDSTILETIIKMRGIDNSGGETLQSVLTGYIFVTGIEQYSYSKYKETWSDLTIEYGSMTPQFIVTFVNDDGTTLVRPDGTPEIQYVNQYGNAEDPTTREENGFTPTKDSTVSTDYTFAGWDSSLNNIGNNKTIKATYTETTRQYNVKYAQTFNNVTEILQDETVDYGTYSFYKKDTPTYVGEEQYSKYHLFNRWDKSGFVDGDKVINAVYDTCYYSSDSYFNGKELTDLSLVETYALTRLVEDGRIKITTDTDGFRCIEGTNISEGDYFNYRMGFDCDYDDLADKTHTLVDASSPKTFTGKSGDYYDTGICLFDTDKDFVLAIDYEFASSNNNDVILVSSYDHSNSRGFKLLYNANPKLQYRNSTEQVASGTNREVLVLRHIAGETGLHVYKSDISEDSIGYIELGSDVVNTSNTTLVFGCGKQTATNYNYFAAGTIHWAKLWFADLGDSICRNLAAYIHEDINLRIAGFNRYYRDNGEQLTSIDFIADRLLYLKRVISTSGNNEGGWALATLNTWLNNRFYPGIPAQFKQLVKLVKVKSREGNRSNNTTSSLCYVYIPAVSELVNASPYNASPYTNESDAYPVCISHMTNENCIMEDCDGNACAYWTRSPSDGNTSSSSNGNTYYIYINASGTASGFGTTTNTYGILIQLSI